MLLIALITINGLLDEIFFQNLVEKKIKKIIKNSIPIFFSLQMKVIFFSFNLSYFSK
jgi:hypothetical protein